MATDDQNIVGAPPLTAPIADATGQLSKSWSIWFRDLYRRTAYKGGNAIDDNKNEIDNTIIDIDSTLTEVIEQVLININNIEVNDENIAANLLAIEQNAEDIATNSDEITNQEYRTIGQDRPAPYQEAGVSYVYEDAVVYPENPPQKYYQAKENIPANAGPFDPSKWNEKSIFSNISRELFLQVGVVKSVYFQFTGRSTNGPATVFNDFNLASLDRTAVGVYEGVATQSTFFGIDVFSTANPFLQYDFSPVAATEAFHIDFTASPTSGEFTINVYQWIQGAGNKIDLVPYDPIELDDKVFVSVFADISGGILPPP